MWSKFCSIRLKENSSDNWFETSQCNLEWQWLKGDPKKMILPKLVKCFFFFFNRNMIKSFYTASLLIDVLTVFGELSEEVSVRDISVNWLLFLAQLQVTSIVLLFFESSSWIWASETMRCGSEVKFMLLNHKKL